MNIDINRLESIKEELQDLKQDDVLYIDENGITKYAIMPVEKYDKAEDVLAMFDSFSENGPKVKVIGPNQEDLSYEEYERIKTLIMEAVEKTFKPKAEKLN